jgi:hypothetical protein
VYGHASRGRAGERQAKKRAIIRPVPFPKE